MRSKSVLTAVSVCSNPIAQRAIDINTSYLTFLSAICATAFFKIGNASAHRPFDARIIPCSAPLEVAAGGSFRSYLRNPSAAQNKCYPRDENPFAERFRDGVHSLCAEYNASNHRSPTAHTGSRCCWDRFPFALQDLHASVQQATKKDSDRCGFNSGASHEEIG